MKHFHFKRLSIFFILMVFSFIMLNIIPSISEAQKKPIKIGFLGPLSLPGVVELGKKIRWGAELGIQYVNEEMRGVLGGRPVEIVVEDDAGTPAEGVAGFRKLVQKDGVVAVMGQTHSSVCLALIPMSKEMGVPLFSTAASASKITESQSPTIFSNTGLIPDRVKAWVDFVKATGWKRVALMAEDTDFGTGFEQSIKKYGADEGIEVKTIVFPRAATDLTSALLTIKAWKPDIFINAGVPPTAYIIVNQAHDIGLFPQIPMLASYDWPLQGDFWDAVGSKGKYILWAGYYRVGMKVTPEAEWMIPKYKTLHNEDCIFFVLNAYADILVIAQGLNVAKSDDPKLLAKALVNRNFQYWNGVVKYEDTPGMKWHNSSPPVLISQQTEVRQTSTDSKLVWPPKFGGDGKIVRP
jgi:branched-chain amino acid transport system substrate-binding protein